MANEPGASPGQGDGHSAATAEPAGSGRGYWLVADDGQVYPFDEPTYGSLSGVPPAGPITGSAVTPGGSGYWLVGADGGIFAFGDARFYGSTGSITLNQPIVGMAATPTGNGYWLVAADGGIFAFGDAGFYGSTGGVILNQPITGLSASKTGRGYRFVASDGGLFSFGDAPYAGSLAGRPLHSSIVGLATSPTGNGYWLATSSGSVHAFGDVDRRGATGGGPIPAPIVAIMAPPKLPDGPPDPPPAPAVPAPAPDDDPTGGRQPAASPPRDPFRIALIGDTGYTAAQDRLLLKTRTAISSRPYAFVVHDGDVHGPGDHCTDDRLRYVHEVFDGFSMPFVFAPGDNEWADCPDPAGRLAAIRQRFFPTDQSLGQRRMSLTRQEAPFVENSRWTVGDVVFATLNVPGPAGKSSGAPGLSKANIAWLNAAFDAARALDSPAVMIIWQDDPLNGSSDDDLVLTLIERARAFGRPVALVHGDSHAYRRSVPWDRAPNVTEVQTFALNDTDWWVEATVDPASPEVFSFAKQQS